MPIPIVVALIVGIIAFMPELNDLQKYNSGLNYGSQAAAVDIRDGQLFNPACDPANAITNDRQHTTEYCNGWNDGYISAWNIQHPVKKTK